MYMVDLGVHQAGRTMGYLLGDWYVKEMKVAKREELLMLRKWGKADAEAN